MHVYDLAFMRCVYFVLAQSVPLHSDDGSDSDEATGVVRREMRRQWQG